MPMQSLEMEQEGLPQLRLAQSIFQMPSPGTHTPPTHPHFPRTPCAAVSGAFPVSGACPHKGTLIPWRAYFINCNGRGAAERRDGIHKCPPLFPLWWDSVIFLLRGIEYAAPGFGMGWKGRWLDREEQVMLHWGHRRLCQQLPR